jgi:hypothetical protein
MFISGVFIIYAKPLLDNLATYMGTANKISLIKLLYKSQYNPYIVSCFTLFMTDVVWVIGGN